MINKTPLWKNLLIIVVLLVGMLYALPNIYGEDPALQITDARAGTVEAGLKDTVLRVLDEAGLTYKSIEAS
ncbi:MAG: protein translocase subunit SecD, partial [Halobacteria archaeon]|nr:protein translocase subunit SecD [Halobacteria archaeon]